MYVRLHSAGRSHGPVTGNLLEQRFFGIDRIIPIILEELRFHFLASGPIIGLVLFRILDGFFGLFLAGRGIDRGRVLWEDRRGSRGGRRIRGLKEKARQ
jgi:hypothetical protein